MKKGLTILSAVMCTSALMACNPKAKVTGVSIQASSYVFNKKPYKVGVTVTGEGSFSKDVTWTTNDTNAIVSSDCWFVYTDNSFSGTKEVEITATSKQDSSKKATAKIIVSEYTGLTESDFIDKAAAGDKARTELRTEGTAEVNAECGENDVIYRGSSSEAVHSVKYRLREIGDDLEIKCGEYSATIWRSIPTSESLKDKFDNDYKDCVSWFSYTGDQGECYGYYVYKRGSFEEEDLFISSIFQVDGGFPIHYSYIEGTTVYTSLNLKPIE